MKREFLVSIEGDTRIESGENAREAAMFALERFKYTENKLYYVFVSLKGNAIEKPTPMMGSYFKLVKNRWIEL